MIEELLRSGAVTLAPGALNTAYILNDSSLFLMTGYKVLQSREKNGFIKCVRLFYNGKLKLYYFSSKYKPLNHMLPGMDEDSFLIFVANLLSAVLDVKNNGFLSCENLVLSMEQIFVEPSTLMPELIYLPLSFSSVDVTLIENQLRSRLLKLIRTAPFPATGRMFSVCQALEDGELLLSQVYQKICQAGQNTGEMKKIQPVSQTEGTRIEDARRHNFKKGITNGNTPELLFSSVNAPVDVRLHITAPEFVIGKKMSEADGVLTFSNTISRKHCRFRYDNGYWYIEDLGSANGTFVNLKRLEKEIPYQLKNGDHVRLARFDFSVQIIHGNAIGGSGV